jgi:hypothetical protein
MAARRCIPGQLSTALSVPFGSLAHEETAPGRIDRFTLQNMNLWELTALDSGSWLSETRDGQFDVPGRRNILQSEIPTRLVQS